MIPHHTTVKFKIGQFLHRQPSSTLEDVYTGLRGRKQRYLCECVSEMTRDGLIVDISGRLSCSRAMQRHFDQLAEAADRQSVELQIVPPRTINRFSPEMTSYRLNTHGTRPEALEIMSARSRHL